MENCLRMAWQLTLKEISEGCNNEENNKGCNNKNFVMSPMSIINALSILAFGSRGRTLEQLLDFLEAKDMDDLKAKVSLMMSAGAPVENTNTNTNNNEGLILSSLNGVWIDQRFPMKPSFKEIAETVFGAETKAVDFVNEAEIVTNKVNLWAKKTTKGLIEKVLPRSHLTLLTVKQYLSLPMHYTSRELG
nr:serpin-zx [Quercus suber]